MDKEKLVIPFPDDEKVRNEIEGILSRSMPSRRSFVDYLVHMVREVGLKHLFRDWTELVFVAMVTLTLLAFMLTAYGSGPLLAPSMTYVLLFTLSPVLYLTIALLFFAGKRDQDTYEVEMVCKYNVYQLAALRMLVFSAAALAVNTAAVIIGSLLLPHLDPIKGWLVSTSSLVLFGTGFLALMRQSAGRAMRISFVIGWLALNLLLYQFNELFYTAVLDRIPLVGYGILIAACGWSFLRSMRTMITMHLKEGYV